MLHTVIYAYCSNALYSHVIANMFRTIPIPLIIYNSFSAANSGTDATVTTKTIQVKNIVIELMINNSCTVFDNFSLSSLTFAHARIP